MTSLFFSWHVEDKHIADIPEEDVYSTCIILRKENSRKAKEPAVYPALLSAINFTSGFFIYLK